MVHLQCAKWFRIVYNSDITLYYLNLENGNYRGSKSYHVNIFSNHEISWLYFTFLMFILLMIFLTSLTLQRSRCGWEFCLSFNNRVLVCIPFSGCKKQQHHPPPPYYGKLLRSNSYPRISMTKCTFSKKTEVSCLAINKPDNLLFLRITDGPEMSYKADRLTLMPLLPTQKLHQAVLYFIGNVFFSLFPC